MSIFIQKMKIFRISNLKLRENFFQPKNCSFPGSLIQTLLGTEIEINQCQEAQHRNKGSSSIRVQILEFCKLFAQTYFL